MLSQVMQDALNDQINMELFSSYQYLAMSGYCEYQNFRGCAHWLRVQSDEEKEHAMKLYDFLTARHGRVHLRNIEQPANDFESIVDVFEKAMEQEVEVSRSIDSLYELAFNEKAFSALVELEWFIAEQVSEERIARDIVHKFKLVHEDPAAMLDLDRELGSRAGTEEGADATA